MVAPALERVDGWPQVDRLRRRQDQQIAVELDPGPGPRGLGLSNSSSPRSWRRKNLLYPGGDLESGSKKLTVTTDAKFQSVEDVANMLVPLPTGGTVRLGEVANVALETTDPDTIADMDTTSCVLLQISKQSGANEVATSEAVVERLDELTAENPSIHYAAPYLASDYINLAVESALQNIALGVVLAIRN